MWQGEPLAGRTLLVHAEQGLGDTLMFARFLEAVEPLGGKVIFEVPKTLVPLLRTSGFRGLLGSGESVPAFDLHVPLLSLPGILGTMLDTIPSCTAYLAAEPPRVEAWRQRLSAIPGFKIGIAWQGNRDFAGDRTRSVRLAEFAPLANVAGVQLISLQKGDGCEQLADAGFPVHQLAGLDETGGAFMDTAAVMQNLDLVVTSDTAIPHLAGGLGVPVWVMLSKMPDWRFFLERDDSPWYASMRLFRQREAGTGAKSFEAWPNC